MTGAVAGGAVLGIGAYAGGERLFRSTPTGGGQPQAPVPTSPETSNATRTSGSAIASRPNDGTGYWPDSSNTGYKHAPGYAGSLIRGSQHDHHWQNLLTHVISRVRRRPSRFKR